MFFTRPGMLGGAGGPASQALSRCLAWSVFRVVLKLRDSTEVAAFCLTVRTLASYLEMKSHADGRFDLYADVDNVGCKACRCTHVKKPERCQDPSSACDMDSLTCRCKV